MWHQICRTLRYVVFMFDVTWRTHKDGNGVVLFFSVKFLYNVKCSLVLLLYIWGILLLMKYFVTTFMHNNGLPRMCIMEAGDGRTEFSSRVIQSSIEYWTVFFVCLYETSAGKSTVSKLNFTMQNSKTDIGTLWVPKFTTQNPCKIVSLYSHICQLKSTETDIFTQSTFCACFH